jgi:Metal binding domain of Ada
MNLTARTGVPEARIAGKFVFVMRIVGRSAYEHVNKNVQSSVATESAARWASIVARDPKADGKFYYSVKTTGVYCRPSCAARLARPENVRFHNRSGRSPRPAAQTPWRWRFLAIVWCAMTVHCQAIVGASNANACFSNGRHGHERSS